MTARQSLVTKPSPSIRWMIRRDFPQVLRIERAVFDSPWREEDFVKCLRQRNNIGMVMEKDDRIAAFMVYSLHKSWIELLNLAVAPEHQRSGVGRKMLAKLLTKLSSQRRQRILLHVRETNLPAQLFFRSMGFQAKRIDREFYESTNEDAYLFQYRWRPS